MCTCRNKAVGQLPNDHGIRAIDWGKAKFFLIDPTVSERQGTVGFYRKAANLQALPANVCGKLANRSSTAMYGSVPIETGYTAPERLRRMSIAEDDSLDVRTKIKALRIIDTPPTIKQNLRINWNKAAYNTLLAHAQRGLEHKEDNRQMRQFEDFATRILNKPAVLAKTEDVLVYVQARREKLLGRQINARTQQKILRMFQRFQLPEVRSDILQTKTVALRKEVAKLQPRRAPPITQQQLRYWIRQNPQYETVGTFLWRTASRVADIKDLTYQDVQKHSHGMAVSFSYKTKASHSKPDRLGMYPVIPLVKEDPLQRILQEKSRLQDQLSRNVAGSTSTTLLFPLVSAKSITTSLRQTFPGIPFSSYSLRRGATKHLSEMALQQDDRGVLMTTPLILKHRGGDVVPDTTVGYLDTQGRHNLYVATGATSALRTLAW